MASCPSNKFLVVNFQPNEEKKTITTFARVVPLINGAQLYKEEGASNSKDVALGVLKDCAPLEASYDAKNDLIKVKLNGEFKLLTLFACDLMKPCAVYDSSGNLVSKLRFGQAIDVSNLLPKRIEGVGFYEWVPYPFFQLGIAHFVIPLSAQKSNEGNVVVQSKPAVQVNRSFSVETLKEALREVLDEKNSDLVLVKKDCPYIPIKSLNGTDGSIYGDGETIYLNKLGKTFKVLGSFHIVRDSDLNLATCYALGLDKEPSLILPEVILKQLQGAG